MLKVEIKFVLYFFLEYYYFYLDKYFLQEKMLEHVRFQVVIELSGQSNKLNFNGRDDIQNIYEKSDQGRKY